MHKKLFLFDSWPYSNWSDWSECDESDCTKFRYRECLDHSWMEASSSSSLVMSSISGNLNELDASVSPYPSPCPVKYIAERQICENKTVCLTEGEPVHASSLVHAMLISVVFDK